MSISTIAPCITRHTRGVQPPPPKKKAVFYKPVGTPKVSEPLSTPINEPVQQTPQEKYKGQIEVFARKLAEEKSLVEAQDKLIGEMASVISKIADLAEDGISTLEEETQDDIFGLSLILDKVTELKRKLNNGTKAKKNSNS